MDINSVFNNSIALISVFAAFKVSSSLFYITLDNNSKITGEVVSLNLFYSVAIGLFAGFLMQSDSFIFNEYVWVSSLILWRVIYYIYMRNKIRYRFVTKKRLINIAKNKYEIIRALKTGSEDEEFIIALISDLESINGKYIDDLR